MSDPAVTVRRILKVNHAGEFGAIRIYGAQIALARRFFADIAPALSDMRGDEIVHCRLFREAITFYSELRPGALRDERGADRSSLTPTQIEALKMVLGKVQEAVPAKCLT